MGKTDTLRVVDPHETALVSGYRAPKLLGISEIMPIIEVSKERGSYTEYGPDASVIRAGLEQPLGTGRKNIDLTVAKGDFLNVKVGINVPLYDEELSEAADPAVLGEKKALLGASAIQLGMESTVANYVQNPANYTAGYTEALAGTARWSDYTNSDPFADISRWLGTTELSLDAEQDELTVAIGPQVWYALRNHPKLLNRPSANSDKTVNLANLANWLGVKEVKVLRGKYVVSYDFKDPRTAAFAHLWGKVAVIYQKIDSPAMDSPLWGAVTRHKGFPEVKTYRNEDIDAEIHAVTDKWGLHVRATNRAFLATSVVL